MVGARLVNATPYGMMIESPVPLEREAILPLRLLIRGEKADIEARVAGIWPLTGGVGAKREFGVGLELTQIEEGARARLEVVLQEAQSAAGVAGRR
jgi:Tfp pilus assembly protein PilZ